MAADGRDTRGRFVAGNTAGKGNPTVRRDHQHRAAIRAAISPAVAAGIVRKLAALAIAGDVDAARVVLERVLGRPRLEEGEPVPFPFDPAELTTGQAVADACAQVVRAAADGILAPDAVAQLTPVLDIAYRAVTGPGRSSPEQRAEEFMAARQRLIESMTQGDVDDDD